MCVPPATRSLGIAPIPGLARHGPSSTWLPNYLLLQDLVGEHLARIEIDREITARMTLPPAWSLIHTLREAAPYELSSD